MWRVVKLTLAGALCLGATPGCARPRPSPVVGAAGPSAHVGDRSRAEPVLPNPASAGPVSLQAILAYAEQHAPEIRVAASRMASVDAERRAAAPRFPEEPTLSLQAGPRWGPNGTTLDYEASIAQTFEIAGERGLRFDVADRFGERADAELAEVRWQVHLRVHAAFHVALVARARVAGADRLLVFASSLMEVAQKRLKAGDISELQVRVAEGELALARQAAVSAAGEYRVARLTLAALSGWPADSLPDPAGSLDTPRVSPGLDGLVKVARERHPALRTRTAAIAEADARARLADREAWPDLTLGLSLGREAEAGPDPGEEHVGLVTLEIPIPLWNRNRGQRARARAGLAIARAEHGALLDAIRMRVARAAAGVDFAAERVQVYGVDIIPKFEESLTMLRRGFELGEMELLDVLVARGRFLELQREALDAYEDYFRSVSMLEAEIGSEVWPDGRHRESDKSADRRPRGVAEREMP